MKGFIPVDIPTKNYIKAYILSQLGPEPIMDKQHEIGAKIYDLLTHSTNERKSSYSNTRYKCVMRIYINKRLFKLRGANLNETNLINFNLYIERKIKRRFYELMDDRIEILPNFSANLPDVRRKLGIDIESWDDDSMKKDYYRYRQKKKKPLFYKRNFSQSVPLVKFVKDGF